MPDRNPNDTKPWQPRVEKEPVFNPFASPVDPNLEPQDSPQVDEEPQIEREERALDAEESARERSPPRPRKPITPTET